MKTVLVTNRTPFQVAIAQETIPERAVDFPVRVLNAEHFIGTVKAAYKDGKVTAKLATVDDESGSSNDNVTASPVADLGLPSSVEKHLDANGIDTVEKLVTMTEQDVIDIKGIASSGLSDIKDALASRSLTLKGVSDDG